MTQLPKRLRLNAVQIEHELCLLREQQTELKTEIEILHAEIALLAEPIKKLVHNLQLSWEAFGYLPQNRPFEGTVEQ